MNKTKLIRCILSVMLSCAYGGSFNHNLIGEIYYDKVGEEWCLRPACKPKMVIHMPYIDEAQVRDEYGPFVYGVVRGIRALEFLKYLSELTRPSLRTFDPATFLTELYGDLHLRPCQEDMPINLSEIFATSFSVIHGEMCQQTEQAIKIPLGVLVYKIQKAADHALKPLESFIESQTGTFGDLMDKGVLPTFCRQIFILACIAECTLDLACFPLGEILELCGLLIGANRDLLRAVRLSMTPETSMPNMTYNISYVYNNGIEQFQRAFSSNICRESRFIVSLLKQMRVLMVFAERIQDPERRARATSKIQQIFEKPILFTIQYYVPGSSIEDLGIIADPQDRAAEEHNQAILSKFAIDVNSRFDGRSYGLETAIDEVLVLLLTDPDLGLEIKSLLNSYAPDLAQTLVIEAGTISRILPNLNISFIKTLANMYCLTQAINQG